MSAAPAPLETTARYETAAGHGGPPDDSGLPPLRLLAAPCSEPPYDDEVGLPVRGLEPLLPPELHLVASGGCAATTRTPPHAPLKGGPGDDLPAPRPFAHALVQRVLEVTAGVRPLSQLRRDLSVKLYEQLERTIASRPRPTGLRPTTRDVRSLHVQTRPEGVAEVCATVRRGPRLAAVALRLEGVDGGWRCTELLGL